MCLVTTTSPCWVRIRHIERLCIIQHCLCLCVSVGIADGGFPAWQRAGCPVDAAPVSQLPTPASPPFTASPPSPALVKSFDDMAKLVAPDSEAASSCTVLDARSNSRFLGTAPEPRPGIPSGHIKGSVSVPFTSLLTDHGTYLAPSDLRKVLLSAAGAYYGSPSVGPAPIASCGSGVTACIIAWASRIAFPDLPPLAVYDGSWSEWAARVVAPKLTTVR